MGEHPEKRAELRNLHNLPNILCDLSLSPLLLLDDKSLGEIIDLANGSKESEVLFE